MKMANLKNNIKDFVELCDYFDKKGISVVEARLIHHIYTSMPPTITTLRRTTGKALSTLHEQLTQMVDKGLIVRKAQKGGVHYTVVVE